MAETFIQRLFWSGIHHNFFAPTKSGVNSRKVKWHLTAGKWGTAAVRMGAWYCS